MFRMVQCSTLPSCFCSNSSFIPCKASPNLKTDSAALYTLGMPVCFVMHYEVEALMC